MKQNQDAEIKMKIRKLRAMLDTAFYRGKNDDKEYAYRMEREEWINKLVKKSRK